jgi:hypothetical protein
MVVSGSVVESPMASRTRQPTLLRTKRGDSESSISSTDSWLSRASTVSNLSSSLSDCFSTFGLPLELELSIMGTVDQSILDRAHVAQNKRTRGCRSLRASRQNSRTRLLNSRTEEDDETRIDEKGLLSTTLCSTEL